METFKTDSITLYNEDCLEVMKQIPDKSCDACICDLPYGVSPDDYKIEVG